MREEGPWSEIDLLMIELTPHEFITQMGQTWKIDGEEVVRKLWGMVAEGVAHCGLSAENTGPMTAPFLQKQDHDVSLLLLLLQKIVVISDLLLSIKRIDN